MRLIELNSLPRKGKYINWEQCVGCVVSFVYDDIEGDIEILDYKNYSNNKIILTIKYKNTVEDIHISNFKKCRLAKILNIRNIEFKFEVGEIIEDCKRRLTITSREYRHNEYVAKSRNGKSYNQKIKWYKYTCNVCGWTEGWIQENNLIKGTGCSCCVGRTVVPHINSIKAKAPWMIDLGVSEEDAIKYTPHSESIIEVRCANCKKTKNIAIWKMHNKKSICCTCGDGLSYPEKFMYSMLKQLNVEFEAQYSPKWAGNKRYDFYVPSLNMIIETHGLQHYEEANKTWKTLKEEQENDKIKKELAIENGIDNYIVIDCKYSDMEYIRDSITTSKLIKKIDLAQVDWIRCEEYALKNIVKEVCDYWCNKKYYESTKDLERVFNLSKRTVVKYLKNGSKLNWCNYNPSEELLRANYKPIEVYRNGYLIGTFASITKLIDMAFTLFSTKLVRASINDVCNGVRNEYKGFVYAYSSLNILNSEGYVLSDKYHDLYKQ